MSSSRVTRRWLFTRGATAAAASAGAGVAISSANERRSDMAPSASSLGSVVGSDAGKVRVRLDPGSRVIDGLGDATGAETAPSAIADGDDEIVIDAALGSGEVWSSGQELVLVEQFVDDRWQLTALQRLYRPLGGVEITERRGSTLETDGGAKLQLGGDTVARGSSDGAHKYRARPLGTVGDGDTVEGIGYLSTGECPWLTVEQIGVRPD